MILRSYSVGAWRRLWAWLVDQVVETVPVPELADAFASELQDQSVGEFVASLLS